MKKKFIVLISVCLFLHAHGQIQTKIELSPDPTDSLLEVIILSDRPVSAASSSYLNHLDFNNRPKNSAQEMLRLVPGLFIAQHAGGGKAEQLFIRGFDCDHGTDVSSFVDGISVNLPSHGHGQGYQDLHFVIPETVSGIAIFKGPYHAQFGNFTTAAAVDFRTKDSLASNILLSETTFVPSVKTLTANRLLGMYQFPFKSKKINSYIAVDGNYNAGYFERNQNFNRLNVFSKSKYIINNYSYVSFTASTFTSKWDASGQIPIREVAAKRLSRLGSIDPTEGGITGRTNLNFVYNLKKNRSEFSSQVYGCHYRFQLFSNFTFFLEDSINGDQIEQGDDRFILGWNSKYVQNHMINSLKGKIVIGTNLRFDEIENSLWNTKTRERLNPKAQAKIKELAWSSFVNESIFLTEKLKLDLGVRFDAMHFNVLDRLPTDSTSINYSGKNYQVLLSPKVNLTYRLKQGSQFFINSGYGFHSNDARSTVQDLNNHILPKSLGTELGSLLSISKKSTLSLAFWLLQLENELVYVGDDGTTENKGSSRRTGIDLSYRYQISTSFFMDVDLNYSKNYLTNTFFGSRLTTDFNIPLAPSLTTAGGISYKKKGFFSAIRYRVISDRPANESNSVIAKGYFILDANTSYQFSKLKCGLSIENVLNSEWNEAQFDTESRLLGEQNSVSELHFTPGTPFAIKLSVQYSF